MKIILNLWILCVAAVCASAMPEQLRNVKPNSLKELEDPFGSVMPAYWEAWDLASKPDRTPEEELRAAKVFALMIEGGLDPEIAPSPGSNAAYKLATLFETGKTVRNDREALKLYEQLAGTGHPEAIYRLGCLYDIGKIADQNDFVTSTYYSMHIGTTNSRTGGSKGTVRLANIRYSDPISTPYSYPKVLEMYQSVFDRAELLESQSPPYDIDIDCLEETYSLWVFAACRIAHMYGQGLGTKKDVALSDVWYQRADKMDMIRHFVKSESVLAPENQLEEAHAYSRKAHSLYSDAKDPAKRSAEQFASIREWCKRAAEIGYESPALRLGWYLEEGSLEPQSYEESAKLYQLIKNNPLALYRLAVMHLEGRDVEKDEKKAFELLKRSVKLSEENFKAGNPVVALPAFYRLAEMYMSGAGGEKNTKEAKRLIIRTEDIPHDRNIPAEIPSKYY